MNIFKRLALFTIILSGPTYAEESKTKPFDDAAIKSIASDLAALQEEIRSAYQVVVPAPRFTSVKITADKGSVFKGADEGAGVMIRVPKGHSFKVVDKISNWYAVALKIPVKGMETGWVKADYVVPELLGDESLSAVGAYKNLDTYTKLAGAVEAPKSNMDRMFEKVLASVKTFKDKYETNPYVSVTGFSVDISVPPSVNISFGFK